MNQIAMILYKQLHCFCMCLASCVSYLSSGFLTCFSVTLLMFYLVCLQSWLAWSRLSGQKALLSPIWIEQLIYSTKSNHYCYQTVFWNTERSWAVPQGCSSVEVQNVLFMNVSFTQKSWFGWFFYFPIGPNILIFFSMNSSILHLSTYVISVCDRSSSRLEYFDEAVRDPTSQSAIPVDIHQPPAFLHKILQLSAVQLFYDSNGTEQVRRSTKHL